MRKGNIFLLSNDIEIIVLSVDEEPPCRQEVWCLKTTFLFVCTVTGTGTRWLSEIRRFPNDEPVAGFIDGARSVYRELNCISVRINPPGMSSESGTPSPATSVSSPFSRVSFFTG